MSTTAALAAISASLSVQQFNNLTPEQQLLGVKCIVVLGTYGAVIGSPILLALGIIKLKDIYDKRQPQKPHKGFAALDEKINGRTF